MALIDDLANKLAERAIEAEEKFGDSTIPDEIGKSIGTTSTTLQEAYNTALRIFRAARRAENLLDRIIEGRQKGVIVKSVETGIEDDPSTMHGGGH